jgi:hypothetical protein
VADGFLGSSSMKFWSVYGFKYLEDGSGKYMSRFVMDDGKEKHMYVTNFMSRYSFRTGDSNKVVTDHISRTSYMVIDRGSNETLGDLIVFNIYPGVFDRVLLNLTGSGPVLWHCGNEPLSGETKRVNFVDLVLATIKPKSSEVSE